MRRAVAAAVALVAVTVCGGGDAPLSSTDAGLIESDAPLWADAEGWRLVDSPSVSIGVDAGEEPYMFYRVRGALRMPDGRILVSDAGAHEVRLFNADGVFISATGRQGQGPGEFGEPATMGLLGPGPSGHVLVTDSINGRINVLDGEGSYVGQITVGGVPGATGGGVIDMFGDGSLLHIATDGDNRLRADNSGSIIRMRSQLRRYGGEGAPLELLAYQESRPRYVNEVDGVTNFPFITFTADAQAVASGDMLWMTTGADTEVWAVDFDGDEVARVRWRIPDRRRSADVYDRYVEESLAGMSRERDLTMYGHLYRQELPLPEFIPAHRDMIADDAGNLWLERYRLPWETQPRWDVVDPERGWLGVVETPPSFQVMQITDDAVIGVHSDGEGVTRVRVFPMLK
jgi:hypothetical protein